MSRLESEGSRLVMLFYLLFMWQIHKQELEKLLLGWLVSNTTFTCLPICIVYYVLVGI